MSGLSEADREALVDVFEQRRRGINRDDLNIFAAVEAIVARHVTAALNEAADEGCEHANVRTFRSIPPHSKCLDCGAVVEKRWTART